LAVTALQYAGATLTLEPVAHGFTNIHCATILWELCKPHRAGLVLRCPNGKVFEIKAEEIQRDRLEAILAACGNEADENGSHAG
jgi:hypothetical protein